MGHTFIKIIQEDRLLQDEEFFSSLESYVTEPSKACIFYIRLYALKSYKAIYLQKVKLS